MKHIYKIVSLVLIFVIFTACASQKSRGDETWLKRAYNNMTAKYNGYFNANVLIKEGIAKLTAMHKDNYNKILDVYPYIKVDNSKSLSPDFDKSMEKLAVVVSTHRYSHWVDDSYLLLGKAQFLKQDYESAEETFAYLVSEYNPEGMARRSKRERVKAKAEAKKEKERQLEEKKEVKEEIKEEKTKILKEKVKEKEKTKAEKKKELEKNRKEKEKERKQAAKDRKKGIKTAPKTIITPKSNPTKVVTPTKPKVDTVDAQKLAEKKVAEKVEFEKKLTEKKKRTSPKSYFLRHRPCYQEGMVWLAKTYIERQNYQEALVIINTLKSEGATFSDVRNELNILEAYYQIKRKNYDEAIPLLQASLKDNHSKKDKARFAYVLAQLQALGNQKEAVYASYDKVLDYSPTYEMAFNAELNKLQYAVLSGKTTIENSKKTLVKMTKDIKNADYNDQIYFAIANIDFNNKDNEAGIADLKQSLAFNSTNKALKNESYFKIATNYFEKEQFVDAKNYYDSTLTVMDKLDERYIETKGYSENLTDIAKDINIINFQDSLLKISKMTPKEKQVVAYNIKKKKEEQQQKDLAANKALDANNRIPGNDLATAFGNFGDQKSSFFAYNPEGVRNGKKDFEKIWGLDRKLEDNWNRSNRRSSNVDDSKITDNVSGESFSSELSEGEVAQLLKDVPSSEEALKDANNQVIEALFELGVLYRDKIQKYKKSIETLEKLDTRYPGNKNELQSWYYLYLSNTDIKNTVRAKYYYDKIIGKYPKENFALVLQDPDFGNKAKEELKKVDRFYEATYALYEKGNYKAAEANCTEAALKFSNATNFKPKFALIGAMCTGASMGKDAYIAALKDIVGNYKNTAEEKKAKEMLRLLDPDNFANNNLPKQLSSENSEFKKDDNLLHYIFIVFQLGETIEQPKFDISDFNSKYFRQEDLKLSTISLSTDASQDFPLILIRKFKDKEAAMKYIDATLKNKIDFVKVKYEIFATTQQNWQVIVRSQDINKYKKFYKANY